MCICYFFSVSQLSRSTNKLEISNTTPRELTAPEHPSSTIVNPAEGKKLASHSQKSSGTEDKDFSDQPSGTNMYKLIK